jgi:molybdate transport system substrate-binding protein
LAASLAGPGEAGGRRLTVLAASSLTNVFPKIDSAPRYSFAGSDQLAAQIRNGVPADVFAAASPRFPRELYAAGLVEKPVVFCTNQLVLIVPASNPARIRTVYDLRRAGIKLIVGTAAVPIGSYTRVILRNLGLSSVLARVVSHEVDVRAILTKVALGEADAGFVYSTDARTVPAKVKSIRLPARAQPRVEYEIAVISSSKNQSAARAFIRKVRGKPGRLKLRAAGFGP